jgi:hypothetical protein
MFWGAIFDSNLILRLLLHQLQDTFYMMDLAILLDARP